MKYCVLDIDICILLIIRLLIPSENQLIAFTISHNVIQIAVYLMLWCRLSHCCNLYIWWQIFKR